MENLTQPNIIIFRLPDNDDGDKVFVEVPILADGTLGEDAITFTVHDGDSFNNMAFSTLILAEKDEDELGAIELAAFDITDDTGGLVVLHDVMESIDAIVPRLIGAYNNTPSLQ